MVLECAEHDDPHTPGSELMSCDHSELLALKNSKLVCMRV